MINKNLANTKFDEFSFPVERGKIKEFAGAICDKNPIYTDPKYATSKGFQDVLAPVTFPMTFVFHVTSENAVLETMQKLGMDVHGEIEFIYERPICAGETLHAVISVGDIYEKTGKRGGIMTFVEHKTIFYDTSNKPVIIVRNTFIEKS